jgi:SAM-dependent methyltransferase
MKSINGVGLRNVQAVYSGAEGDLWELVMGQQIHLGGLGSTLDLAEKAHLAAGSTGVDLCCCNGAGMRALVRFRNVAAMRGVDATEAMICRGQQRTAAEGLADRIAFTLADVCDTGLPSGSADFVWGEDAWCYVEHKDRLIAEAARLVRDGGTIAFTDWVEGPRGLSDAEAQRFLAFMKFPNFENIDGYAKLLADNGCRVECAADTGRFPRCVDLYLDMLNVQLTYDALRIIGFDMALMQTLGGEMQFIRDLAHAGKIVQGLFIARK